MISYNSTSLLSILIIFPNVLTHHFIHDLDYPIPQLKAFLDMCVHTSHRPYGIHLLCCDHDNKHVKTHDAIRDTFATIAQDFGFHMGKEHLHALPSTTFNSSHQQIDIVFTKDDICTLADIVTTNPMRAYLLPRSNATQGFATLNAIRAMERSCRN